MRSITARKPSIQLKNYPEVAKSVTQIFSQQLLSPMTGRLRLSVYPRIWIPAIRNKRSI